MREGDSRGNPAGRVAAPREPGGCRGLPHQAWSLTAESDQGRRAALECALWTAVGTDDRGNGGPGAPVAELEQHPADPALTRFPPGETEGAAEAAVTSGGFELPRRRQMEQGGARSLGLERQGENRNPVAQDAEGRQPFVLEEAIQVKAVGETQVAGEGVGIELAARGHRGPQRSAPLGGQPRQERHENDVER